MTVEKPQADELKIDWNGYQAVVAYDFKGYQWDIFVAGEYIDSRPGLAAAVNDAVETITERVGIIQRYW